MDDWGKCILAFIAGIAVGYLIFQALHRTTVTELTRDEQGRLITILEKTL